MKESIINPNALIVTSQSNMLEKLQNSEVCKLIDECILVVKTRYDLMAVGLLAWSLRRENIQ